VETLTLDLRPSKCAEVKLGPALLRGTRTVHIVLDRRCDRLYEVGARECFVLSRLDGRRTLSEIGEQYAARFGRRLGAAEWARLLALLGSRNLLAGPAQGGAKQAQAAALEVGWRRGNLTLPGLSAFARRLCSWLPPRVRGYLIAGTAIAAVGMLAVLADRLPELASQATDLRAAPWLLLPLLALLCLGAVCHELAHALVALHLGVRDVRIGARWDLPLVIAYCKAEEVVVLARRRQRAAVALAGPLSHWAFLIPFFAIWLALPSGAIRDAAGTLLLVNGVLGLFSCAPWPGTDGYLAIGSTLNASHLYTESFRYLALIVRRRNASASYPTRARWVYSGYAATIIVAVGTLATAVGWLGLHAAGAL
jgi:putative peptide zinc metalloprotease protein